MTQSLAESAGATKFSILGPLSITNGPEAVVLQPSRPATLLASLLLRPNSVIPTEFLLHVLWGEERPASAKSALHVCVLRLRRIFASHGISNSTIESIPGGYRIVADADTLDLIRFRELLRAAAAEKDPEDELVRLRGALAMWEGPLLSNVASPVLHRDEVPRLAEEWLRAAEWLYDTELVLGRCRQVIADLWRTTRAHPGHERFWEQLIEALYRTGRQMEALAEYRRVKMHLRKELGIAPGIALQKLELAILRGEDLGPSGSSRAALPARTPTGASGPVGPREISAVAAAPGFVPVPRPLPDFTDREEIGAIVSYLTEERSGNALVVISGAPGIGKTALAIHVTDLVRDAFPAGCAMQWMGEPVLSMQESPERYEPTNPGVPTYGPSQPVADTPHRRALLVLDDVITAEQVRPLLNLGTSSTVIVTSRLSLAGLVATHGGQVHRLQTLAENQSYWFLTAALGTERVAAEPDAARELATFCGHFPIALRIAAARLLTRPRMGIKDCLVWLRKDPCGRLSIADDPRMSVAGLFNGALERLRPELADTFLNVASLGERPFSVGDASAVLGLTHADAEEVLERLVDVGLLEGSLPGSYLMHDLLRRFAPHAEPRQGVATVR